MQQFLPIRKAFLIAALVFVLNYVLGTAVVLQLNLSDPGIGGSARDSWLASGTQLGAPAWFMVVYVILLVLATRQWWIGILGTAGVTLLTLLSGLSWIVDWGMVLRVIEHHLTVLTTHIAVKSFHEPELGRGHAFPGLVHFRSGVRHPGPSHAPALNGVPGDRGRKPW